MKILQNENQITYNLMVTLQLIKGTSKGSLLAKSDM